MAQHPQLLGQFVLHAQLGGHAGHAERGLGQVGLPFDPGRDGVVGQLGLVAHAGTEDGRAGEDAVIAEGHLGDQGQPVFIEVQGGQVRAQALRQHVKDTGRCVHRRRVVPRMIINGGARLDECVHVCNGHHDTDGTLGQGLDDGQLVQVPRIIVVDGAPGQGRQVADVRAFLARRVPQARELPVNRFGELRLQSAAEHGHRCNRRQGGPLVGQGLHRGLLVGDRGGGPHR